MKKVLFYLLGALMLNGCGHDFSAQEMYSREQISKNVEKVFGTKFDADHAWCTTVSGEINVSDIPSWAKEVRLLVQVKESDGETSLLMLNKAEVGSNGSVTLKYDAPSDNLGIYVAFVSDKGYEVRKVSNGTKSENATRAISTDYTLPSTTLTIDSIEDSYASKRGWIIGEKLYQMNDYTSQKMQVTDYNDEYKEIFRAMIFSYFKNGRKYENLPLVQASGFYNENAYPITTGDEPIIISPVYKNDGGYQEIVHSDLYYFYFKESDIVGDPVSFLEGLPKYKAIQFDQCIKEDDEICKHAAYALIYWGDGTPTKGTVGSYSFPEGYKIGFMVRAKTTAEGGKKQGELYGDGRLNSRINFYGNFKSSKLGADGPRMAWLTINGRMLLCCESGTDSDFNDIIMEVEGGVEPIIPIPDIDTNSYTFCFEDTPIGDYDMNDLVIRARRLNETQVEYSIVACGAFDKLYVMNIDGSVISNEKEVHQMFGVNGGYVNTTPGESRPFIVDVVTVDKEFSFLDEDTQPYIYDASNNCTVKVSKRGEDPHGIMIPYDFKYPIEKVCIKDAYPMFNSWGENQVTDTDWYIYPNLEKVWQ